MDARILLGLGAAAIILIGFAVFINSDGGVAPTPVPIDTEESLRTSNINDTLGEVEGEQIQMAADTLEKPELTIDQNKTYTAKLSTTEGDIEIKLHADKTPVTANNFIYLANNDFYNGTIFHRVIDGFMIQGGDPTGTGTGGPGYTFDDEPFEGEYSRGTVAMANSGPNTNGSQFFIMHKDYSLPPNYVIFGEVVNGMDVVDKIATAEVESSLGGERSKPVNPVKITSVNISEE